MKRLTPIIILFLGAVELSAQTPTAATKLNTMSLKDWDNVFTGIQPLVTPKDGKVHGSPFLYDEYLPGSVYLGDSMHSPDKYQFKLNLLKNEIWMLGASGTETILTNQRLAGLVLNKDGVNHTFKRLVLPFGAYPVRKFVEIFYCGSITLIKEIQKQFFGNELGEKGSGILNGEEQTYETKELYYLADERVNIKKVRPKLSDIYELYPSVIKKHKEDLESFCRAKSINKNLSELQLTELLTYISTLKTS